MEQAWPTFPTISSKVPTCKEYDPQTEMRDFR